MAPPPRFQLYGGKKRATEIVAQTKADFARPASVPKAGYIEPRGVAIERLQNRFANPNAAAGGGGGVSLKKKPTAPLSPSRTTNPNHALFTASTCCTDRPRFLRLSGSGLR